MQVYGREYGRGDVNVANFAVNEDLLERLFKAYTSETPKAYDEREAIDEEINGKDWHVAYAFNTSSTSLLKKAKAKFNKRESFYILAEEAVYGFGATELDAKLAWVEGDEKNTTY